MCHLINSLAGQRRGMTFRLKIDRGTSIAVLRRSGAGGPLSWENTVRERPAPPNFKPNEKLGL
jgi:hypothetical protein